MRIGTIRRTRATRAPSSPRGAALRNSYYGARVDAVANAANEAVKQFGASVGKGIESAGEKMKDALGGDGKEAQAEQPD